MVKAGLRDETLTIPTDPAKAAVRLRKHFRGERLAELVAALTNEE